MRIPVQMFMEENGRYVDLVASPKDGIEFTVARIDKHLLNFDFVVTQIDVDSRRSRPVPEPELSPARHDR